MKNIESEVKQEVDDGNEENEEEYKYIEEKIAHVNGIKNPKKSQ